MCQPPDPVFPSLEDTDEKLVRELVEGKRSRSQAQRVLQELSGACKEASVELEVMLQVGRRWVLAVLVRLVSFSRAGGRLPKSLSSPPVPKNISA